MNPTHPDPVCAKFDLVGAQWRWLKTERNPNPSKWRNQFGLQSGGTCTARWVMRYDAVRCGACVVWNQWMSGRCVCSDLSGLFTEIEIWWYDIIAGEWEDKIWGWVHFGGVGFWRLWRSMIPEDSFGRESSSPPPAKPMLRSVSSAFGRYLSISISISISIYMLLVNIHYLYY